MAGISVKAYLMPEEFHGKDEIRRFTLDTNVANSFTYLREKLIYLFPVLLRRPFSVLYKDEEGDFITVSSDEELITACLTAAKNGLLRLNIKRKRDRGGSHHHHDKHRKHDVDHEYVGHAAVNTVHKRVACDGCDGPVIGFRYKCMQCPDFDLCMSCENKQIHAHHLFMRIPSPETDYPRFAWAHDRHSRRHHWGHGRRLNIGKFATPGCKTAESETSDDAPSDQERLHYPFQFNQVLDKIWTTLGGLPRESPTENKPAAEENKKRNSIPQAEYLLKVGNSVAALLNPLSIDVDVDVVTNNVKRPEEAPVSKPEDMEVAKENFSAASTVVLRNPEEFKVTVKEPEVTSMLEPQASSKLEPIVHQLYPVLPQGAPQAAENTGETDGWMYVDVDTKEASFHSPPPEDSQRPNSTGPPITSLANELDDLHISRSDVPPHSNPTIQSALNQMLSMGFTNEGGWLTQLLEVKNGNIDDVLEVLAPVHRK
ncbi:Sequestosome-1 [Chamberlinius hualienensis]